MLKVLNKSSESASHDLGFNNRKKIINAQPKICYIPVLIVMIIKIVLS